ncbi:glycosyltransferase [Megalodesulfovibrio gigas]|uniref:glycosyltransferase n=1 Tax=Megalodesulfovibrio gigas TaxID=879 RepID=UPI000688C2BF|nr:glycosyltransferase [Megalodesulfovibrio gigas]
MSILVDSGGVVVSPLEMMDARYILDTWTAEVLSFRMAGAGHVDAAALSGPVASPQALLARAQRLMQAAGRSRLLALGAETALLPHLTATGLPCLVVETRLDHARHIRAAWPHVPLLADSSPWALLLLLTAAGWAGETVQPLQTAPQEDALVRLARLLPAVRPFSVPATPATVAPSLSLAAILHPQEPDLAGFFAHLPPWLTEAVLVWDAPDLRDLADMPATPWPVRQEARPLTDGFHQQRNHALSLCGGEWVLLLDADERLPPEVWAALPSLMAAPDVDAWWLPRETLHPDAEHCLIGYGLWPDLQLRLFRRRPGLHFAGAVHERLQGVDSLPGGQAVACQLHIRHEQRLRKTPADLAAKLARFDVLGGRPQHLLQQEYPVLPRNVLHHLLAAAPEGLLLPRRLGAPGA